MRQLSHSRDARRVCAGMGQAARPDESRSAEADRASRSREADAARSGRSDAGQAAAVRRVDPVHADPVPEPERASPAMTDQTPPPTIPIDQAAPAGGPQPGEPAEQML